VCALRRRRAFYLLPGDGECVVLVARVLLPVVDRARCIVHRATRSFAFPPGCAATKLSLAKFCGQKSATAADDDFSLRNIF
jgi:hypothetical protein